MHISNLGALQCFRCCAFGGRAGECPWEHFVLAFCSAHVGAWAAMMPRVAAESAAARWDLPRLACARSWVQFPALGGWPSAVGGRISAVGSRRGGGPLLGSSVWKFCLRRHSGGSLDPDPPKLQQRGWISPGLRSRGPRFPGACRRTRPCWRADKGQRCASASRRHLSKSYMVASCDHGRSARLFF